MTLHGRVIAPTLAVIGVLDLTLGIVATLVSTLRGWPLLGAIGFVGIVAGGITVRAARVVWRWDERARRNGWPE